jgi:hypothetical protein
MFMVNISYMEHMGKHPGLWGAPLIPNLHSELNILGSLEEALVYLANPLLMVLIIVSLFSAYTCLRYMLYIYIYTRIYIFTYAHTHVYIYIYIHTYTYLQIMCVLKLYIYIPVVSPLYPHVISHSIPLSFLYIPFFFKVDTHKYSISQYINMSHCKYQ